MSEEQEGKKEAQKIRLKKIIERLEVAIEGGLIQKREEAKKALMRLQRRIGGDENAAEIDILLGQMKDDLAEIRLVLKNLKLFRKSFGK